MTAYIDSSVVLQHILLGEQSIAHALSCERVISCELIEIECHRVIQRLRLQGDLGDEGVLQAVQRLQSVLNGFSLIGLSRPVQQRAMQAYPVHVKTLDALHLAAAEYYRSRRPDDSVLVFTHDAGMNRCAAAMGFPVPLMQDE